MAYVQMVADEDGWTWETRSSTGEALMIGVSRWDSKDDLGVELGALRLGCVRGSGGPRVEDGRTDGRAALRWGDNVVALSADTFEDPTDRRWVAELSRDALASQGCDQVEAGGFGGLFAFA